MKHIRFIKRIICVSLVAISLVNIVPVRRSKGLDYSSAIGTNKALNVPLVSDTFTYDDWNSSEMLCFAAFLSNFVQPMVDSFESAFVSGLGGSEGAGAEALKFSAGGDVDGTGALNQMLNWVINTEKSSGYASIKVKYRAFDGNELNKDATTNFSAEERNATVRDLFLLYGDTADAGAEYTSSSWDVLDGKGELMDYGFVIGTLLRENSNGISSQKGTKIMPSDMSAYGNLSYRYDLAMKSNLPIFYTGTYDATACDVTDDTTVWNMSDGWDVQMWSALLYYMYSGCNLKVAHGVNGSGDSMNVENSLADPEATEIQGAKSVANGEEAGIGTVLTNMLDNFGAYELKMDCFGNIGIYANKAFIIIIPACMNKNLTKDGRINLLVSPIINSYCQSSDDLLSILIGGTNERPGTVSDDGDNYGGGSIATLDGSKWGDYNLENQKSKLLVYESSDYIGSKILYDKKFWSGNDDTSSIQAIKYDESFTASFKNFLQYKRKAGVNDSYLRIEVIGAGDEAFWDGTDGNCSSFSEMVADFKNIKIKTVINRCYTACQTLAYAFPYKTDGNMLDWIYRETGKSDILGDAIYGTPGTTTDSGNGDESASFTKYYINYCLKLLNSNDTLSNPFDETMVTTSDLLRTKINGATTFEELAKSILCGSSTNKLSDTAIYCLCFSDKFGLTKKYYDAESYSKVINNVRWGELANGIDDDMIKNLDWYGGAQLSLDTAYKCMRSIARVYTAETPMKTASNYFSLEEGTDFAAYATWIYLSYLDFYGVLDGVKEREVTLPAEAGEEAKTTSVKSGSYFKENTLFKGPLDNIDAEELFSNTYMTAQQKKDAILDYEYLLLSPGEKGREYRLQMKKDGVTDWLYEQYTKITYGKESGGVNASSKTYSTLLSSDAEGFLHIYNYEENFLTSWVMKNYSKVVMWGILFIMALLVVFGIIQRKKIGWFIMSVGAIIIMFVLAPSVGEITPYVCERMVNKMFSVGATRWAVDETIENITLEHNMENEQDGAEVLEWVSMLRTSQMNKTILVKKDISRKIIEAQQVDYSTLQSLRTTRWMLSAFMEQIRTDEDNYDYVYTTLADLNQFSTDNYLYYNTNDEAAGYGNHALKVKDGKSAFKTEANFASAGDFINKYKLRYDDSTGFNYLLMDTRIAVGNGGWSASDLPFSNTAFYLSGSSGVTETYSLNKVHSYQYILHSLTSPTKSLAVGSNSLRKKWYKSDVVIDSNSSNYWNAYADKVANASDAYKNRLDKETTSILSHISNYNHNDTDNMDSYFTQSFGYLLTTENLGSYFYSLVKDTFFEETGTKSLPYVISQLQGATFKDDDGKIVRESFMHFRDTGYTKDVLDLREVFTNVVPYMYQMQVNALGTDNDDGLLAGKVLGDEYPIYKNAEKGWMYRCNWVTKLMEAKNYKKPTTVTGWSEYVIKDGVFTPANGATKKEYSITCELLPQAYPGSLYSFDSKTGTSGKKVPYNGTMSGYRPMIFSEAQMRMLGLEERDLSSLELACVNANRDVVDKWTLMVNYANTNNVTKEAIYRVMAVEALMVFNKNFTTDNLINKDLDLYPSSLDLRNISFDSVMKLVILSNSNSSDYTGQNAMKIVIQDGGVPAGVAMLVTAWLCDTGVPIVRTIGMGLIFYAGVIAALWNVMRSRKEQGKMCIGMVVSHTTMTIVTILYYSIFYIFVTKASTDEVLSVGKITADTGVPIWKFIIIALASVIYLVFLVIFVIKMLINMKDMGFAMFKEMGLAIVNSVNKLSGKAGDRVKSIANNNETNNYNDSNMASMVNNEDNSTKISNTKDSPIYVKEDDKTVVNANITGSKRKFEDEFTNNENDSGYIASSSGDANEVKTLDIDEIIKEGRNM